MISTSPIRISCVVPGDQRPPTRSSALHARVRAVRRRTRSAPSSRSGSSRHEYRVAVVGATGAVGTMMLDAAARAAASRPTRSCRSPASARRARSSATPTSSSRCADDTIQGFDVAIFSAGGSTSRGVGAALRRRAARSWSTTRRPCAWTPRSRSSSPRSTPTRWTDIGKGIVANPNCTTMAIMLPLKALHDAFGLTAIVATSFQAAGGAGQKGMDELAAQVRACSRDATRSSTTAPPRRAQGRGTRLRQAAGLQRRADAGHRHRRTATPTRR